MQCHLSDLSKGGCNNHLYVLSGDKLDYGWKLIDKPRDIPSPRQNSAMGYCILFVFICW